MRPRVLLIDNYDSFVYNIAQILGSLGAEVDVRRNGIAPREVSEIDPDLIVISPGPGHPKDAGNSPAVVERFSAIPILGVCLGHQIIGWVHGAQIEHAPVPVHGKASPVEHDGKGLYSGIDTPLSAIRYHSLVVSDKGLPRELEVTARTPDGLIMGLRHRSLPSQGVQFHPESILTMGGRTILSNFLRWAS